MTIQLEQIDRVIERTGADYATAKKALQDAGGDEVEAIILIEKNANFQTDEEAPQPEMVKETPEWQTNIIWALKKVCKAIEFSLNIKVIWKKKDIQLFEVPLLLVLIFAMWLMPYSLIIIALPFFFGIKMYIKSAFGKTNEVSEWLKSHTNKL